jgi:hypothetical protein
VVSVDFLIDGVTVAQMPGAEARAYWRPRGGPQRLEVVAHLPSGASLRATSSFLVEER